MKWIKMCPLLLGVASLSIILSVIAFCLKDTVYSDYLEGYKPADFPFFTLLFRGVSDGVFPWDDVAQQEDVLDQETIDSQDSQENEDAQTADGDNTEDDDTELVDISGNDVSGNDISGNSEEKVYELTEVDDDYFTDALFIGDSRTVGLSEYCESLDTRATFYAKVSLTIYTVLTKEFIKTDTGKIGVEEALSQQQFGKIYIMLGLNEIGTGTTESFCEAYQEVIDRIRELQPDAIIYIQGIMHVTANKSDNDKHFNNKNINDRNAALAELADNETIFYIDMNESVDDEDGNLISELSFDDVHLKASAYERWHQFLLQHAIVKD